MVLLWRNKLVVFDKFAADLLSQSKSVIAFPLKYIVWILGIFGRTWILLILFDAITNKVI